MDELARDVGGNDSLRSVGRVRRYWWLVLLGALLGLLAGALATSVVDKQYSSTTTLSVLPMPDTSQVTGARVNSNVNMDNELQHLSSGTVISAAEKLMHVTTDPTVIAKQVTATVPANTTWIDVTFLAGTPEKAQQGSHAFAEAYLEQREQDVAGRIAAENETLTKQLADYSSKLATYSAQVATLPTSNSQER